MWPCLLLKYCACDGVVSCQSTAPATGLSFWNIGPAALRDLLNTPRSPAAMLRQCEMDWSCHMLLYSVPQQHCRRGCGGAALPAQKLSGEKMQDHMEVRPWRPHGMFFISQERRNISRDENLHVLWSQGPTRGMCPHFGLQAFMKAMDILAGNHRQRFLVSDHSVLTCII